MTQNATVKKNQNEIYKMIIIAQCMYDQGTYTHLVQLLSHYSAFLKESTCMELESMQIIYDTCRKARER